MARSRPDPADLRKATGRDRLPDRIPVGTACRRGLLPYASRISSSGVAQCAATRCVTEPRTAAFTAP